MGVPRRGEMDWAIVLNKSFCSFKKCMNFLALFHIKMISFSVFLCPAYLKICNGPSNITHPSNQLPFLSKPSKVPLNDLKTILNLLFQGCLALNVTAIRVSFLTESYCKTSSSLFLCVCCRWWFARDSCCVACWTKHIMDPLHLVWCTVAMRYECINRTLLICTIIY